MKKYLLGIIAVVFAIGFSAFTTINVNKSGELVPEWYELIPMGNPANPSDYEPVPTQPCDDPTGDICGVFALDDPANPGHPDFNDDHTFVKRN